ncbi:glutamate-5-semialdehyde dehydrogenase [Colwellia sp. 1_MG-2023]|uniref:glutamate-5-semialdehyde dehydrogenase n=1 Tax=Colwellia sp. 1_MG-2023 TaxID=3062649 RepID=UPI0026E40A5F|nr:glutamate-5-semialdehyde dehydrogenase [Colwellia sp. 1_MG-2023]MDO6444848.1 glutamate-5-semialdehyde dehydrogenase [Colwellia sp. 1_MG-2023]
MSLITTIASKAAQAAKVMAIQTSKDKALLLNDMAKALRNNSTIILQANALDINFAQEKSLSEAMLDRLQLNEARIEDMAIGLETVAEIPDVVGTQREQGVRPNGLKISKMRVPLGVICMIYEARPNVTADAAGLCIKSGNAVILRGGKEALNSSLAIANVLQKVLVQHQLPKEIVTVIDQPDRALMTELLMQKDHIDLVIPRGGEGLINFVSENSQIPVIQHYKGVCHLFVDEKADIDKALALLLNGKTQRTGVCNALEGLLVHQKVANKFLPLVAKRFEELDVKVNGCPRTAPYFNNIVPLTDSEFGEEYLSLEIAIRVVDDFGQAIEHIDQFGSHHTEVICTEDQQKAMNFQRLVDASVVMVNASSRFSDGSQLGLGAEIGIATSKLHAYGPMGIESLTTEKYLVNGEGQVRA